MPLGHGTGTSEADGLCEFRALGRVIRDHHQVILGQLVTRPVAGSAGLKETLGLGRSFRLPADTKGRICLRRH